jgi:hypothetical protein
MRLGKIEDPRYVGEHRLRKSVLLPLQSELQDLNDIYYHESQISSLCWGPDESCWTELFFVETYFGSEPDLETYLRPPPNMQTRDPPTRQFSDPAPYWDPREYWLKQLDVRLAQVSYEYAALIGTLTRRMEAYVSHGQLDTAHSIKTLF